MAAPRMKKFDFLGDDGLVDALLMEVADLLSTLIADGRGGSIDLLGLPLSAACLAEVEARLGDGEICARLNVSGESLLRETSIPGVWWARHVDDAGNIVALLIEVAEVPEILKTSKADMKRGLRRLSEITNFSLAHTAR